MKAHHAHCLGFLIAIAAGIIFFFYSGMLLSMAGVTAPWDSYVVKGVLILVFALLAIKILNMAVLSYGRNKKRVDEKSLVKVISLFGYVIIILLLMTLVHINITGILVGAGFFGIVVGLASQSTLGNLFAGVAMMAAKPFANGDRITFSTWQYGMLPPSHAHSAIMPE